MTVASCISKVPGRQAEGADGKVTVKASFRALHVTRQNAHLCITYLTKEKKQKMYIDGTEWNGVKFFQLSTQWQTHVKTFPWRRAGATRAPGNLELAPNQIRYHPPRRTMVEQISRLLGEDGPLPECVALATAGAAPALHALGVPAVVAPAPQAPDARPLLQALYSRAGKQ
ncbi:hypothetical protein MSG28_007129 [Choristoneura fumiferana]|uniref:Uncharacterized protein n=1 Tax=Choristoneura fumiferana TaxID=7141 RepID=A0ACC0JMJ4_CHOFU|nr:hypothetical protein MSG28_007129 [Choristoneura fumiferana]